MRIQKIYLETSIFNFVFAEGAPDKKADTLQLFEEIKQGKWQPYTSGYVADEIDRASEPKKTKMKALIKEYGITLLDPREEVEKLAQKYVDDKIIPEKYATDAYHIATASVYGVDIIVSWNFKHIVKIKTIRYTEGINILNGYNKIMIHSPTEVIEND